MALFHSHCLVILSLRKQCWQQQFLIYCTKYCALVTVITKDCPSFGGNNCLPWYKTSNHSVSSWYQVEGLPPQRAGCHTNQHMAPSYMNGCQRGSDVARLAQEQRDLHQGQYPKFAELWKTTPFQYGNLSNIDLIIITIFHTRFASPV